MELIFCAQTRQEYVIQKMDGRLKKMLYFRYT